MTISPQSIRVTLTLRSKSYEKAKRYANNRGIRPATWLAKKLEEILDPEDLATTRKIRRNT